MNTTINFENYSLANSFSHFFDRLPFLIQYKKTKGCPNIKQPHY